VTAYATASDLAGLPGFPSSEFRARAAAARLGLPSRPRPGRGGGLEYAVEALPPAARLAWAARCSAANEGQMASTQTAPQARASASRGPALVTGWRKDRQDAIARVLVLFQRFWQAYGGPLTPALKAFCHAWSGGLCSIDIPAEASLREAFPRITFSSLRAWHLGVQEKGLAAITPREHHRKGQYAALAGEVGNAMLALLIDKPHLSAQTLYDALATQFPNLPTVRSFRRALGYWKSQNAQLLEAVVNPDGWRNKYMSAAGSYSEGITAPNQKWEMDSTVGDVMLNDGRRHHVVGVIDVFTRRRLFIVTRTSRANAIMSLIRLAILAWGVPEEIKTDNGADYVAEVLDSALLGLNIRHSLCHKFSPHEKPHIERAIGSLMHQLFETLGGYIGHSVAERKGIEARKGFADRIMKDESFTVEMRLSPEQLQGEIEAYCNHLLDKPRSYLSDRTPRQMATGFPVKSINERALDVLLAPSAHKGTARVGKKGLKIGRGGFYNHALLGGMEGQTVQIKIDDSNIGRCWVFDLDGIFVCEALDYARLGINSAEVAAERKAHQVKVLRESKKQLKALTREFDTNAAIAAINRRNTDAAVEASNVVSIHRTPMEHTSPTIESITTADAPMVSDAQIAAAQVALVERLSKPAEVKSLHATPQERYARWLLQEARVQRGEALTPEEKNWFEGYVNGAEWASQRRYFETFGLTPEQVLAG